MNSLNAEETAMELCGVDGETGDCTEEGVIIGLDSDRGGTATLPVGVAAGEVKDVLVPGLRGRLIVT